MERLRARERRADHARRVVYVLELDAHGDDEPLGEPNDLAGVPERQPPLERAEDRVESLGVRPGVVPSNVVRDERRVVDRSGERLDGIARLGRHVEPQAVAQDRVTGERPEDELDQLGVRTRRHEGAQLIGPRAAAAGDRQADRHTVLAEHPGLAHRTAARPTEPSRGIHAQHDLVRR